MNIQDYIVAILLSFIIIGLIYKVWFSESFDNIREFFGEIKFKSPPSFTLIKSEEEGGGKVVKIDSKNYDQVIKSLKNITRDNKKGFHSGEHGSKSEYQDPNHIHLEKGNNLTIPQYFSVWDKWPGCLPEALFQGNCGSCWAFAVVTTLSSRFYIESCGVTGCRNYPQLNQRSLDETLTNIDLNYKFSKTTLQSLDNFIDTNKNGDITEKEWINSIKKAHKKSLENNTNRFIYLQLLIYVLNFQSLGSIHFTKNKPNTSEIIKRGYKTFKLWSKDGVINLKSWENKFLQRPIPLSPEKMVACCYPKCYNQKDSLLLKDGVLKNNPQCSGGTLVDAWKSVRDTGTTTSLCIGYNLDKWEPGDPTKNCKELLGPNYSYCSGYTLDVDNLNINLNDRIKISEKTNFDPITINRLDKDINYVPWTNPQLFRFKAKNAYKVNNSVGIIQREILNRGPVTTGFQVYPDFQYEFGNKGMGGQKHKKGDKILGGSANSLIYAHIDDGTKPLSGHAITITGWGNYKDIPYWICLNSWGVEWGTSGYTRYDNRKGLPNSNTGGGYFWFVRGINNCEFEDNVVAGQPNLKNITYPGTVSKYGWGLPYPNLNSVKLIGEIKNPVDENDVKLNIGQPIEGGGHYNFRIDENNWEMRPMKPPSPYTFFWPEERPKYLIGELIQPLYNKFTNNTIIVDSQAAQNFKQIIKIQPNPVFIINSEQVQFIKLEPYTEKKSFKTVKQPFKTVKQPFKTVKQPNNLFVVHIHRGIDRSKIKYHNQGSKIVIFPFRNLNIYDLEFLPKANSVFSSNERDLEKDVRSDIQKKLASETVPAFI
jgi:hypothetical protein